MRRVLAWAFAAWVLLTGLALTVVATAATGPDRRGALVAAALGDAQRAAVAAPGTCAPDGTGQGGRERITKALFDANFRGEALRVMVAVSGAESGFSLTAANPGSSARGFAQILLGAHQDLLRTIGTAWWDPDIQARMAWSVYAAAGHSFKPWVTYTNGDYRRFLGPVDCGDPVNGSPAAPSDAPGRWGPGNGYINGRIPDVALCRVPGHGTHRLRCDAAQAFARLDAAYQAAFGHPLVINDSYRSYSGQVAVYRAKPGLAAVPGTSNHGWGLALDLGIGGYTSRDYLWLRANGPRFGWDNPKWARPGGSKREPWHHEFIGT
jgi:hypothetical protein